MGENTRLDEALASLPQDIEPSRDLWPQIRAEIKADLRTTSRMRNGPSFMSGWAQLAAGFALVTLTAVTTYYVTRQSVTDEWMAKNFISTQFDASTLGPDYLRARADLDRLFEQRIASLPPETRTRLQGNLAELRRAADDIAATLAQHPNDSLLQELLVSTRRRELQLLADITRMSIPNS